jgi:hypothetical protein
MYAPVLLPVDLSFNATRGRTMLAFPPPACGMSTPVPDDALTEHCRRLPYFVPRPVVRPCGMGSAGVLAVREMAFVCAGREGDRL